jgi:hypothetical protein
MTSRELQVWDYQFPVTGRPTRSQPGAESLCMFGPAFARRGRDRPHSRDSCRSGARPATTQLSDPTAGVTTAGLAVRDLSSCVGVADRHLGRRRPPRANTAIGDGRPAVGRADNRLSATRARSSRAESGSCIMLRPRTGEPRTVLGRPGLFLGIVTIGAVPNRQTPRGGGSTGSQPVGVSSNLKPEVKMTTGPSGHQSRRGSVESWP